MTPSNPARRRRQIKSGRAHTHIHIRVCVVHSSPSDGSHRPAAAEEASGRFRTYIIRLQSNNNNNIIMVFHFYSRNMGTFSPALLVGGSPICTPRPIVFQTSLYTRSLLFLLRVVDTGDKTAFSTKKIISITQFSIVIVFFFFKFLLFFEYRLKWIFFFFYAKAHYISVYENSSFGRV